MLRVFVHLAYFLGCATCFAQQYPFVQYTPKDGLVNSRVRKAYQDSKGRMYFLTYSGLSVYDGARFRNYTTQNGMISDLVNDVLEIGDDSLLVAINTGEVNILAKAKMSAFKTENNFYPLINQFYLHNKKDIYISSDDGLFILKNNRFQKLNILRATKGRNPSYLGAVTGLGNYLLFTTNDLKHNQGLFLYDIKADSICDMLPDQVIYAIGKDERDRIWVGSPRGIFHLDSISLAKGKLLLVVPPAPYREAKDYPTALMTFDKTGAWFTYVHKKLIHITENGELLQITLPELISTSGVRNILIDRENTIWLSVDGAGVFKLANINLQISESPAEKPMAGYTYKSFCFKDTTWYSTGSDKLLLRSRNGLTEFSCNITSSPNIFHQEGNRLLANDARNIYEATLGQESNRILFHTIISISDTDNFGKKLIVDPNGYIIASLRSGISVWKQNKLLFHLPLAISDLIEGLAVDKNQFLWVISRYQAPTAFSLHPEDPSKYLQPAYRIEDIPGKISPRCFVIDPSGLIWIGTRNHGLFAYMLEEKQWKNLYHFYTGNGLMDNFVTSIACDSSNNIIAGTQTGLDRIVKDTANTYRVENLTKSSNFFAYIDQVWTNANNHSFALTNTGRLLEFFVPLRNKTVTIPQLIIEEVRVNAQPVPPDKNVFSFKENNISFSVAAPSFIDEAQVSYSYLLEGSGNNIWSDTTPANSVINLINLPAGNYLLKVKAFFPSTAYAPVSASYHFGITPPWWQTVLFRLLAASFIMGLLIIGFRLYYRRKLEKQKIVLEKQQAIEKERTRIATDMHDDLGAGLSRIKFLSETIGIKKQQQKPIEEDISKIREYAHEMIDKMGEIVWALNEKNDSLSDLLSYTRSYAMEYLSQNGVVCTVDSPEQLSSAFVSGEFRRNVFLAVKEILHNVVKHSQANYVTIEMNIDHGLLIKIRDDGIGFDRATIRPFSNGLANIEKRMKEIDGAAAIQSTEGTGVTLTIPLSS